MELKPNLFLDLDATLISAQASEDYDAKKYHRKSKKFVSHDMDGYYTVFERPALQEFLDYAFKNFNVSVWTAATQSYALFIVEKCVIAGRSDRHLDYVLFNYHCGLSKTQKGGSKDLKMLWDAYGLSGYNHCNTIILDDYDEVNDTQPCNCIIAEPFEFMDRGSDKDDFLKRVVITLEKVKDTIKERGCEGDADYCLLDPS